MKNPKFYYIAGTILCSVSAVIILFFLFLPSILSEFQFIGWISFAVVILFIIVFIYGIYLLKKGNFIKLNKSNDNYKKQFEEEVINKEREKNFRLEDETKMNLKH